MCWQCAQDVGSRVACLIPKGIVPFFAIHSCTQSVNLSAKLPVCAVRRHDDLDSINQQRRFKSDGMFLNEKRAMAWRAPR